MGIRFVEVSKTFSSRQGDVVALGGVNFMVGDEEFICVVGPSGCGKSTLLRLAAGLLEPTGGEITFDRPVERGQLRAAMVFQELGLFPWMTVLDNVAFSLEVRGVARRERRERASAFLRGAGLAGFSTHYPHELSGGMRQQAAILRAFLAEPQILLMDEPFGALDSQIRLIMQEELLRIWKEHRRTILYVTHDIEEAILLADRIIVMSGRPGAVRDIIAVNLERPRQLADLNRPALAEMRLRIWKMLEDEVRRALKVPA